MIDTLKITKRLIQAKMDPAHAEVIAESIAEVTSTDLVTKADLANLKMELNDKINELNDKINSKATQILWVVVGVGALNWITQFFR
jgi:hypothetical protein